MKPVSFLIALLLFFIISPGQLKSQPPEEIIFQTEGTSFSPVIQLKGSATVLWTFADGTTSSSLNPAKDYGSSASMLNRLSVNPWSALRMINIGYDAGDGGSWSIPMVGNQHVSEVKNLELVKDYLKVWCSSYNQLDTLIFDDFVLLDTIECFLSQSIRHVSLKNTPALTRLCLEDNNLSTLDISDCTGLKDLRGAVNNYPTINFADNNDSIWHICVRDNPQITNDSLFAHMEMFPDIAELFIWNDNQKGAFKMSQNHPSRRISLLANWNHYSAIDLEGALQNESGYAEISFEGNELRSVNLQDCDQLKQILLGWNGITTDTIDKILLQVDEFGTSDGILSLVGNQIPSLTGMGYLQNLEARGWTVTIDHTSEICVMGNGLSIADDDYTPSNTDSTDFGLVFINDSVHVRYIVKNIGNLDLESSGDAPFVRIGGTDASFFRIEDDIDFPIPGRSVDTLVISFLPDAKRMYNAEIFINSNDGNENPFNFGIRGMGMIDNADLIAAYDTVSSEILFISQGSSFSPLIQLNQEASVIWTFADGTTSSSLNPNKIYGADSARMNRLKVIPWNAVQMINIGYDGGDGGWDLPHVPDQQVSYLKNISLVKDSLKYWCSSFNLLDTLNFDNFTNIEDIECYRSTTVTEVSMKNTPKLRRLCLEDNNLSEYNISEATALEDIRGALNNYSTIIFSNSTEEFWHICVRDNPQVTNDSLFAHMENFPNISELFIWNMNQRGKFKMEQNHPTMNIAILADGNRYSAIDFRGSLQNEDGYGEISFNGNQTRSVELAGCDQLKRISLGWNGMASDTIDKILHQVDQFGTYNGTLDLVGNGMASAEGVTHSQNLIGRGWTVYLPGPRIEVWANNIEIANNDTIPASSDNTDFGTCNIGEMVNHDFTIRNPGQNQLHLNGSPRIVIGGTNPSDFLVTVSPDYLVDPWGNTENFRIAFTPKKPGLRKATVSIANDGVDNKNPYSFTIQGEGNPQISDTTLAYGTISCFGSETILTLAGDGSEVHFENGASVNLIAFQSVIFLPGFHAEAGSAVQAWITTDGTFCGEESSPALKYKSTEQVVLIREIDKSCYEEWIKVYPNPNRGIFILQFENIQLPVDASLLTTNGSTIFKTTIANGNSASFNLPLIRKGLYFVIVNNGRTKITKKIIIE